MTRRSAGDYDRYIKFEIAFSGKDAAGDEILVWPPDQRASVKPKWARVVDSAPRMVPDVFTEVKQALRSLDTTFEVRNDSFTRRIAPETMRIVYKGRRYNIIGLPQTNERGDGFKLLAVSHPDQRGTMAPEVASGTSSS